MLIYPPRITTLDTPTLYVWDTQTGVIISRTEIQGLGDILFSSNQRVVCLLDGGYRFCVFDAIRSTQIHEGRLPQWPGYQLGAYWAHEDILMFATGFKTNQEFIINTQEFQLTSNHLYPVVESFHVPPHDGKFSFSPVSFHASFVTKTQVTIIDVQNSNILLQVKGAQSLYTPLGQFSPDGCFFACGTQEQWICVWKNTSTNYMPWSNLRPRLSFKGFSFSPTMPSILTWDQEGIQLLHINNQSNDLLPNRSKLNHQQGGHLVAHSTDWVHIATARQEDSNVIVLDSILGTLQQSINTGMEILDIKIVEDSVFVVDRQKMVSWHLHTGASSTRAIFSGVLVTSGIEHIVLSNDCSQIAFSLGEKVSLYDIKAQAIIGTHLVGGDIFDIRFLPGQYRLHLFRCVSTPTKTAYDEGELAMLESRGFDRTSTLEDGWSWANLFSHGYHIGSGFGQWIVDPRGRKLLWLPPNWRAKHWDSVRWNGNFLTLVGGHHPEPIVIQFYP